MHNDLGNALSDLRAPAVEVLHHYSAAARLLPSFAEAFSNVGTVLKERGAHAEAAWHFEHAIGLKPVLCEAYKKSNPSPGNSDLTPRGIAVKSYEDVM